MRLIALLGILAMPVSATEFDVVDFGATPDDSIDDTSSIKDALAACREAGGGEVLIPAGTFILSRRGTETPILEVSSNTTLRGVGTASTLKFDSRVNEMGGNFWRMIGAPVATGCSNVTIRDLHLDGSNNYPRYVKGETPEHNAGLWFYNRNHLVENINVENVFAENFSGDCMAFSRNCRSVSVRNCTLRNFLRQGIQLGGSERARDYLVSGCRDLKNTVRPGGSTIHVEHARGLRNVIIENNQCRNSILAGGVDGMIIRGNTIEGRLVGNGNTNLIIQNNIVRATGKNAAVSFGYTKGLLFCGNIVRGGKKAKVGIYVWGNSKYNAQPGERVTIANNQISSKEFAIHLNGTQNVHIHGNILKAGQSLKQSRTRDLKTDLVQKPVRQPNRVQACRAKDFQGPERQGTTQAPFE